MLEDSPRIPKIQFDQLSWSGLLKVVFILALVVVAVWASVQYLGDASYVLAFALGGLLGLTEILGRYPDSPTAALKSPGAFFYELVNACASAVALYLILKLATQITNPIVQVLLAGLGAMAFLRSSVFKVKVADEEVAVGPAIILDTLLKFADAQVDRGRAVERASRIADVMGGLPLAQAGVDLPRLCLALMQNLPVDVRQRLLDDITLIVTDTKRSDPVKVMEIGLILWSRVGIGTLRGAVELLNQPSAVQADVSGGAVNIVPPAPQGNPQDLLPEIEKQLAKDREAMKGSEVIAPVDAGGVGHS